MIGNDAWMVDQLVKGVEIANIHPMTQFMIFLIKRKNQVEICSGMFCS